MAEDNHIPKLLAIIASVFLIGYFLESYRLGPALLRDYFQISTELLPLVLSFSIFIMTWFVYHRSRDNHSLFMGWVFLAIGLLDLYHILSYPFMPDFITSNSSHKADIFWGEARIVSAILFLASVYIYKDTSPWLRNQFILFVSIIILSFLSLLTGVYPEYFPLMTHPDGSPTKEKMMLLIISSLIILYASYLYTKRLQKTGQNSLICLIYGFILIVSSNFVYLFYEYPAHLLRAAGFYFLYLGLFKSSIELPYEKLVEADEKLIREAEERYRNLFDNANDAILTVDREDRVTSWNRSAERIFGWTSAEIIGNKLLPLMFEQVSDKDYLRNAVSGGTVSGVETTLLRKDGRKIDVSMTVSPLLDINKNVTGLSGIIRDVTERKRAEEEIKKALKEKEILLREIHHRVKNNMQIISSLLKLQSGYIKDQKSKDMYKESQNRIITMSLIHEKLYQSRDLSKIDLRGYIRDLVTGLFQSYEVDAGKIALDIDVQNVPIGINSAIPCGLVINELVSNSLKYAFPQGRAGEIKISLRSVDDMIELIVADNGVGIPGDIDFRKTESWGLRLVKILAENQLHAEINLDRSKGTEFKIKFRELK